MVVLTAAKFRANCAELLSRVAFGGKRLVVSRHGHPIAAVVPLEDLERLVEVGETGAEKEPRRTDSEPEENSQEAIPLQDLVRGLGVDLGTTPEPPSPEPQASHEPASPRD